MIVPDFFEQRPSHQHSYHYLLEYNYWAYDSISNRRFLRSVREVSSK